MDPKLFEVEEAGGGRGWMRADRVMEAGFWEEAADRIADRLAEGGRDGVLKHGEKVYRWRWTAAGLARRATAARAALAAAVREKRAAAASWLASEEGESMAAAAGYGRLRPREILAELAAG